MACSAVVDRVCKDLAAVVVAIGDGSPLLPLAIERMVFVRSQAQVDTTVWTGSQIGRSEVST